MAETTSVLDCFRSGRAKLYNIAFFYGTGKLPSIYFPMPRIRISYDTFDFYVEMQTVPPAGPFTTGVWYTVAITGTACIPTPTGEPSRLVTTTIASPQFKINTVGKSWTVTWQNGSTDGTYEADWELAIADSRLCESRSFAGSAGQNGPLHPVDEKLTYIWAGDPATYTATIGSATTTHDGYTVAGPLKWQSLIAGKPVYATAGDITTGRVEVLDEFPDYASWAPGYTTTRSTSYAYCASIVSGRVHYMSYCATLGVHSLPAGPTGGIEYWAEYLRVVGRMQYKVNPFDQMVLGSGLGLQAQATYIDDPFDVPGTALIEQADNGHNGHVVLTGPVSVVLTDATLEALNLPTADNRCTFDCAPLNSCGHCDLDDDYDDLSTGCRYGILKLYRQSPLSVQWPQDLRGEAAPPSWWSYAGSTCSRSGMDCTVAIGTGGPLRRVLRHYVWDVWTNANRLIVEDTYPPNGTSLADAHTYLFNYDRSVKSKHGVAGLGWDATVPITAGVVDWAGGTDTEVSLQNSEDVYCWENYGYARMKCSTTSPVAVTITLTVEYETYTISDSHDQTSSDRQAAWSVTRSGTLYASYQVTVPANASEEWVTVDLFSAANPRLQVVNAVQITLPPDSTGGASFTIHDLALAGYNPTTAATTGDARMELVYPRLRRYGGEKRYDAEGAFIGWSRRPEEATAAWLFGDGCVGLNSPDDELHDVGVAPEGIEAWNYVVTDSGTDQSELRTLAYWGEKVFGDWGQEGLYGTYTAPTGEAWVDAHSAEIGAYYFSDVPELLWKHIADADLLDVGRTQAGTTDLPVCVRCGSVTLAEGQCWVNDSDNDTEYGDPIQLVSRKFLYGSRIATAAHDSAGTFFRATSGVEFLLYEKQVGGSERQCCATNTDNWGRLRFTQGVNELRHTEGGVEAESDDPDHDRPDFLSDVVRSSSDTRNYGLHHYQEIPTAYVCAVGSSRQCRSSSVCSRGGDGVIWRAFDGDGSVWVQKSLDRGRTWGLLAEVGIGWSPSLAADRSGGVYCLWQGENGGKTCVKLRRILPGGVEVVLMEGHICPAALASGAQRRIMVPSLGESLPRQLTVTPLYHDGASWVAQDDLAVVIDSGVDLATPGITELPTGAMVVVYSKNGTAMSKTSRNGGATWT